MTSAPVSVLMSTYAGEHAAHLAGALDSVFAQTLAPAELILVVDGPVDAAQEVAIRESSAHSGAIAMRVVRLPKNRGLALALNAGLAACSHDWIMRMDSDDLSLPHRLERQWSALSADPTIDLLATWHAEFADDVDHIGAIKATPPEHDAIVAALKWRNVISHPTIMFRKATVARIGAYRPVHLLEDYDLYVRLVLAGARLAAIPEPLVKVRTDPGQRRRRGGLRYVRTEVSFRIDCYRHGFLTARQFTLSTIAYVCFRIAPSRLKARLYRLVRRPGVERG